MTYDPGTYVPTMQEAERDIHDLSECSHFDPCPACERAGRH